MRGCMAQKSLAPLQSKGTFTENMEYEPDCYGIRTPTFMQYEPFLLGMRIVFNELKKPNYSSND